MAETSVEPFSPTPMGNGNLGSNNFGNNFGNGMGSNAMSSLRRLRPAQQLMLGGAFVAVVMAVLFLSRLGGSTSMGILYTDLDPETAAGIVDELERTGVPYELTDSGRVVWVPRQDVASVRLDMSSAGLATDVSGWSILDDQGITSSQFEQRVGFQRAMEGELASTIAVIDGVASANVHLVIPEQDIFVGDEIEASASVLLQMEESASLSPNQVQAVVSLVSSSVEGLTADAVTVTDDAGRLLAGPNDGDMLGLEQDGQARMKTSFQAEMERELNALLDAVVGPGRSVVTVNADLDFDAVTTMSETFEESVDADGETLPLGETTRLEEYTDSADPDEGTLEIEEGVLDLGDEEATAASPFYRLDERDVSYALDKVVTTTERAPGSIRSLSVAVVVDEGVVDAAQIEELETMVSTAVGADLARGDQVAVSLLPFEVSAEEQAAAEAEAAEAAEAAAAGGGDSLGLIRTAGSALLALVVLVLGVLMLRKGARRNVVDSIDLEALEAATAQETVVRPDPETGELEEVPVGPPNEDDLFELVANQPDDIAAVLRQWLTQPESVR